MADTTTPQIADPGKKHLPDREAFSELRSLILVRRPGRDRKVGPRVNIGTYFLLSNPG